MVRTATALLLLCCAARAGFALPDSPAEEAYARAVKEMSAGNYRAAAADLKVSVQAEPSRAPLQFAYAFALNESGQNEPARAAILNCLKLDPNYPGASFLAGEIESDRKNFNAAITYYQKAQVLDPKNIDIMNSLGLAFASLGRYREASSQFQQVTELQSSFAPGHYNLGLALLNLGNPSYAEKEFRRALQLAPDYDKAKLQLAKSLVAEGREGDREKTRQALEVYRQILQSNPKNLDAHFGVALANSQLRDDQAALAEYRAVARVKPDYPLVQFYLGYTEYWLKDYPDAVIHLRGALAQGTNTYLAQYCLGSSLLQVGQPGAALAHLEAAARLDPKDPSPHFQLAKLYTAQGKSELAARQYDSFRDLSAQREERWHLNALENQAATALEGGETVKGIDALKEVYASRHDISSARNLGLAYLQSGKLAEARQYLEEAMKLSPNDAATHDYLGLLAGQEGKLADARQEFERAARLDPSSRDALYNAGLSAYELHDRDAAIKYLRAALAQSDSPEVHRALALALADAGKSDEAQQHLEDAGRLH